MKRQWIGIAALVIMLFGSVMAASAQSRSLVWRSWDVVIDQIDTSGNTFRVTEQYVIDFNGTFRFGTAAIPLDRLDSISGIEIIQGGRPLTESCSGNEGTFCARRNGNDLEVTYYFTDPVSGEESIEFSYIVAGALRVYPDGDQLYWDAIPTEHFGFGIERATITVEMPDGFAPREGVDPVVTYGAPTEVDVQGNIVTATATRGLGGAEGIEIRVQYPHNPSATPPRWQSSFDSQRDFEENTLPLINLGAIALALVIAIGGGFAVYAHYNARGRDPEIGPVPEYLSEPPSDLRPAVVGSLIDETADPRDVIATFIDLAHRGYIVIEESKTEGLFGIGGGSTYTFKRTDKPFDDLKPWERTLVNSLFKGGVMERNLSALKTTFYMDIANAQKALYTELVSEGFFKTSPEATRSGYSVLAMFLFGIALFAGFGLFARVEDWGFAFALLPVSLFIPAVGVMLIASQMPAKTQKGAEEAAKWKAFYKYIANLEKYGSVEEAKARFDEYLPYAVAFGLDKTWVGAFQSVQNMPVPYWYYPTYMGRRGPYVAGSPVPRPGYGGGSSFPGDVVTAGGGGTLDDISGGLAGGLDSISSGLTRMFDDASRIMTSRPQSASSGSSGSWRSGGSSFSGGGFRGGGGSGGGSRGFG